MESRYPHPSEGPVLPLLMIATFLATVVFLRTDAEHSVLAACFAFAWFLVAFALQAYTWLHREHALWLAARRDVEVEPDNQ
jgi:hypothetical protein